MSCLRLQGAQCDWGTSSIPIARPRPSAWQAPSTPEGIALAASGRQLRDRASPHVGVDGNDFLAVYAATRWAADRARANRGATLIELFTCRAASHSTSDDPSRYRAEDEWRNWPYGDPVQRLSAHLTRLGEWSPERHRQLEGELAEEVREAAREAERYGTLDQGPTYSAGTMFEDVFKEMPWHLRRQRQEFGA